MIIRNTDYYSRFD